MEKLHQSRCRESSALRRSAPFAEVIRGNCNPRFSIFCAAVLQRVTALFHSARPIEELLVSSPTCTPTLHLHLLTQLFCQPHGALITHQASNVLSQAAGSGMQNTVSVKTSKTRANSCTKVSSSVLQITHLILTFNLKHPHSGIMSSAFTFR